MIFKIFESEYSQCLNIIFVSFLKCMKVYNSKNCEEGTKISS